MNRHALVTTTTRLSGLRPTTATATSDETDVDTDSSDPNRKHLVDGICSGALSALKTRTPADSQSQLWT